MNKQQQKDLKALYHTLTNQNCRGIDPYLPTLRELIGIQSEFDELKELLHSDLWPAAVDEYLICDPNSEEDKLNRAEGIVELIIDTDLKDKKFLDFGCGEGHVVHKAAEGKPKAAVGYDIESHENWIKYTSENAIFTTDIAKIEESGPYDAILLYDVLDHMESGQVETLQKLKTLLKNDGSIYARVHPFGSRHATHLYHTLNKAFVHLVFTDEELKQLGFPVEPSAKLKFPLVGYGGWISRGGLRSSSCNMLRESIEPIFLRNQLLRQRIVKTFKDDPMSARIRGIPNFQMEIQFCDYVLKK
jgi:SAM-dependent methyltransferase